MIVLRQHTCPEDEAGIEMVICNNCKEPADYNGEAYFCPNKYCENGTVLPFNGYTKFCGAIDDSRFTFLDCTPFTFALICDRYEHAQEH